MRQTIADFNTSTPGQPTPPAGWTTPSGGGLNLITDITVDTLGRKIQVLGAGVRSMGQTIDTYKPDLGFRS